MYIYILIVIITVIINITARRDHNIIPRRKFTVKSTRART